MNLLDRPFEKDFNTIKRLNQEGITILLVEQDVQEALEVADRCDCADRPCRGRGKAGISSTRIWRALTLAATSRSRPDEKKGETIWKR
jgi:ABC-type Mn2+/Zn2+ transport system ATPase subunit